MTKFVECYVALGSNLGDSLDYLDNAVNALQSQAEIKNLVVSKFYQSKPHGPQNQPDYFNAVVMFETSLESVKILDCLQKIENDNKRVRKGVVRWGARTLDLDLLFYGSEIINTKRLTVPHPRICERAFVLLPLRDLGTDLKMFDKTSIKECIEGLSLDALNDIKEVANGK